MSDQKEPNKSRDKFGLKLRLSTGYETVPIWFATKSMRQKAINDYKKNKNVVQIIPIERR